MPFRKNLQLDNILDWTEYFFTASLLFIAPNYDLIEN